MSVLRDWYASGGRAVLVSTLEVSREGTEPLRFVAGFEDVVAGLEDGTEATFTASPVQIALRKRDNSGSQRLTFGFQNVSPEVMQYVEAARQADAVVMITHRTYLDDDLSAPSEPPIVMQADSGKIQDDMALIQCSHFDIINTTFNRANYTAGKYPGIRHMK